MTFGHGWRDFLVDSPTAVGQAVLTRLLLWTGEWFLNEREGMPWMESVLTRAPGSGVPDSAIRDRIMRTPYVTRITDYSSTFTATDRRFTVSCKIFTAFGQVLIAPEGALMSPSGALVMPLAVPGAPVATQQQRAQLAYARALPAPGT